CRVPREVLRARAAADPRCRVCGPTDEALVLPHECRTPGRRARGALSLPRRGCLAWHQPVVGAAQPADVTDVVMASTRGIAAGRLSLAREDRIEHWIIDLTSESGLGTVTIP